MNEKNNTLPNAAGSIILFTLLFGIGYLINLLGASEGTQVVVSTPANTPVARNDD